MADLAGNSATQAKRIGLAEKPRVFRDRLDASDSKDFYRFSLRQRSSFKLQVDDIGAGADVNLELRNGDNQVIWRSAKPGQLRESINQILDKGKYFIGVLRKSGDTDYRLKASAAPPPDLAGNTPSTARKISLSGTPSIQSDFVSANPIDTDYYAFTLTDKTTRLRSSVSGVTANVQVNLFDSTNRLISSNTSSSTPDFEQILGAGTYYAQVQPLSGSTSYKLSLTGSAIVDTAGETIATARAVTLGTKPTPLEEFIGTGDSDDYYQFTVRKSGTLTGTIATKSALANDSRTLRVSIRDANDRTLASYQSGLDPTFSYSLKPGVYYVRVSQVEVAQADYRLDLSAV
ncbi:PPC domain-containing protein [Phormidium tenue FACHB-886]|nr:PPC domain-containing protein [Phormidium tenue FACHB-886]